MAHLWDAFISETQAVRDQIGIDALESFLSKEERNVINLNHNAAMFPERLTSKKYLRSKDIIEASVKATRVGGVFRKKGTAAKLLRDIKENKHFELAVWQIEALSSDTHICPCDRCHTH